MEDTKDAFCNQLICEMKDKIDIFQEKLLNKIKQTINNIYVNNYKFIKRCKKYHLNEEKLKKELAFEINNFNNIRKKYLCKLFTELYIKLENS